MSNKTKHTVVTNDEYKDNNINSLKRKYALLRTVYIIKVWLLQTRESVNVYERERELTTSYSRC